MADEQVQQGGVQKAPGPNWHDEFGVTVILKEHEDIFALCWEAREAMNDAGEQLKRQIVGETERAYLTILTSAIRSLWSVVILCNYGHGPEAHVHVRQLFQYMIWLFYIRNSPASRSYLFNRNFPLTAVTVVGDLVNESKWAFDERLEDLEFFRESIPGRFAGLRSEFQSKGYCFPESLDELRRGLELSWALCPFSDLVKDVLCNSDRDASFKDAVKQIYARDYKFDCHMTHGSGAYFEFVVQERARTVEFTPGPSSRQVSEALLTALKYASKILLCFTDSLGPRLPQSARASAVALQNTVVRMGSLHGVFRARGSANS